MHALNSADVFRPNDPRNAGVDKKKLMTLFFSLK